MKKIPFMLDIIPRDHYSNGTRKRNVAILCDFVLCLMILVPKSCRAGEVILFLNDSWSAYILRVAFQDEKGTILLVGKCSRTVSL